MATSAQLDQAEQALAAWAMAYRDATTEADRQHAIAAYAAAFARRCDDPAWHRVPDVDSQLPHEDMPAAYHAARAERLARR